MIPEACQCAEYCLGLNTFSFFPICCFIKVAYTSVTSLTIQKIMEMVKKKKKKINLKLAMVKHSYMLFSVSLL